MTVHRPATVESARPVRLRLPRGSVPVLQAAARRGAALPQRGARLLGVVPARRRAAGLPQQHHTVQPRRRVARPDLPRPARDARRCRSSPWTTRPIYGCAPWCRRASRRAGSASSSHVSPRLAVQHLDAMLEKANDGTVDYVGGIRRQAADGRHLGADGRTRRGPRPDPGHGRRRDAPRGRRHRRAQPRRSRRRST